MHFIEHADRKDSMPKAKGRTPKYSAWEFSDSDWNMIEVIIDALKVCSHHSSLLGVHGNHLQ
jgi:hypothetical protein